MKLISTVRSILMTPIFIVVTLTVSILSIINNLTVGRRFVDNAIIKFWGKSTCALFNIKIKLHHPENIPAGGAVFLFNHSSFMDIFALASVIPGIRFGAKIELFKIPIFGYAIRRAGTLPIDRQSREEVFKVYEEARERIKNNERFILAPEGTRFYGENLSPFKSGPFIFAITSGAVISPIVMKGVHEVLPKNGILTNKNQWQSQIDVYVLPPVSTMGYSVEARQELQKIVYEKMNAVWTSPIRE